MSLLMDWLSQKYPHAKRQTLRQMVADGRVTINGQRAVRLKEPVGPEDRVEVGERLQRTLAPISPLEIVHEDADVLVIIKPAGLLTSTKPGEPRRTAIAIIRAYLADRQRSARAGVIHRLDRDASGLLVFSKNDDAFANLKKQFFHHSVDRVYTAVVHGRPKQQSGRIESLLIEMPDGSMRTTDDKSKGEHAVTDYKVIAHAGKYSVLHVRLHTGRKHQIRAHLSQRGHPIVGDTMYGPQQATQIPLMLSATLLAFDHPRTGQRVTFEVPPPDRIRTFIKEQEASH